MRQRILVGVVSVALGLHVNCGGGSSRVVAPPGGSPPPAGTEMIVVVGETNSSDFPTTPGAFQSSFGGGSDGLVTLLRMTPAPQVVFSTYFGGSGTDQVRDAFIDGAGNVYIVGRTTSRDLPTTAGVLQRNYGGDPQDGFIAKFSATGQLVFCTYLGGSSQDNGYSIFVDDSGFIYAGGRTSSANFPVTAGAFQTVYAGGVLQPPYFGGDAFVSKLRADGSGLVWSTYVGGASDESLRGRLTVDPAGNVYAQGVTQSSDFPVRSAAQPSLRGAMDTFVFKLSADGSRLVYSTFLGGLESTSELAEGIAVNASGEAFVCGFTTASSFPTTPGAFQTAFAGTTDAFVARLSASGALQASTLLGGGQLTDCQGLDLDSAGNPVVLVVTSLSSYPTTNGVFQATSPGGQDLAVTKLTPNLSAAGGLQFSTFVGSSGDDRGDTLRAQLDSAGNVYFVGSTNSGSFPITGNAVQSRYGGGAQDIVIVKLAQDGTQLLFSTFLGGSGNDNARSLRRRML